MSVTLLLLSEYMWPKEASQDGLAEAIQLLSCKPSRLMMHNTTATSHLQGHLGYHPSPLAFVEEDHQVDKVSVYCIPVTLYSYKYLFSIFINLRLTETMNIGQIQIIFFIIISYHQLN